MNNTKKEILDFFEIVCEGIRSEYEDGASVRDLKTDRETLSFLLSQITEG